MDKTKDRNYHDTLSDLKKQKQPNKRQTKQKIFGEEKEGGVGISERKNRISVTTTL